MYQYKEIITDELSLNEDMQFYQKWGWELVSHAVCSNHNFSIILRKEQE